MPEPIIEPVVQNLETQEGWELEEIVIDPNSGSVIQKNHIKKDSLGAEIEQVVSKTVAPVREFRSKNGNVIEVPPVGEQVRILIQGQ
ncbi:MAG: hypothetical protein IH795_00770 [Bacteroidetes bacterium]|nr:hypothetical protein [Bacteroidota bacterium]